MAPPMHCFGAGSHAMRLVYVHAIPLLCTIFFAQRCQIYFSNGFDHTQ